MSLQRRLSGAASSRQNAATTTICKHAALMILHDLLGKPPYVPWKAKLQKSPISREKIEKPVDTGTALDRVRRHLRGDALSRAESKKMLLSISYAILLLPKKLISLTLQKQN